MAPIQQSKLKIFFLPSIVGSGHIQPVINAARLFALVPNIQVRIITTKHNALVYQDSINRDCDAGLDIVFQIIRLPTAEVGLPDDVDGILNSTSNEAKGKLFMAFRLLKHTVLDVLRDNGANCLVSDPLYPWALEVAKEADVPWIVFHSSNLFVLCAQDSLSRFEPHVNVGSDSEPFLLPGLPDEVRFTRSRIPDSYRGQTMGAEFVKAVTQAVDQCYCMMVNTCEELESDYVKYCNDVLGRKICPVGPLHCCSFAKSDGDGGDHVLEWLGQKRPSPVVYVSFGSYAAMCREQFHEIAHGLEKSRHAFVWVARANLYGDQGGEGWFPEGFEERVKVSNQGLIIKEWAPQEAILNHPNVGAFMTHCGWNSCLESLSNGVVMITWPLRAEQFFNESLVVDVLKVGVRVGNEEWMAEHAEPRVTVRSDKVEAAVRRVMEGGEEVEEMRRRVGEYKDKCNRAVEKGGTSYGHVHALVDELRARKEESKSII